MAITQQRDFLAKIIPFDRLPESLLSKLANTMDVVYLPKSSEIDFSIIDQNLYLIIKGKIAEISEDEISAHYGIRSYFGDAEILKGHEKIGGTDHKRIYQVVEEAIFYKLPASLFIKAFTESTEFADFFKASIVDKLNREHQALQSATSTEVMMDTVISAPIQTLVEVNEKATLLDATKKMTQVKSDATLVHFADNTTGIITSTDVLRFVAEGKAERLNEVGLLKELAHKPIYSVHEFDYLFNALLKMTRFQVDRLAVRTDDGYSGFLHQKDLMSLFANQSGLILTKVDRAQTIDELILVGPQVDDLIKNLNRKGIKTHYIAKLVNELHRKMISRLIEMLLPLNLQDKVCVFVMGSEGRSEQVIRTDQDNALLYRDDLTQEELSELQAFTQAFSEHLQLMGFPPCPGNIMLSNPEWCLSRGAFLNKVQNWYQTPSDENFMYAAILFDGEAVFGADEWLTELKGSLLKQAQDYPVFLRHFAISVLRFKTPIGFFGRLIAEEDADHNQLDIKKGGIFTIVHGVRCYALEAGIAQTNTHWRIKALMDKGVFNIEFGIELGETLNFLNTLRLDSMIHQLEQGDDIPDNNIRLSELSHLQQDLLKQSFKVVDDFKKKISHHFDLHGMM